MLPHSLICHFPKIPYPARMHSRGKAMPLCVCLYMSVGKKIWSRLAKALQTDLDCKELRLEGYKYVWQEQVAHSRMHIANNAERWPCLYRPSTDPLFPKLTWQPSISQCELWMCTFAVVSVFSMLQKEWIWYVRTYHHHACTYTSSTESWHFGVETKGHI